MDTPSRPRSVAESPTRDLVVRLTRVVARVVSLVAYLTPVWLGYLIADIVGHWMFWRFGNYRNAVVSNLSHVYGERLSQRELRQRARWVFRVSARNFWDLCTVPHYSRRRMRQMHEVVEGSWEILQDALAKGRGVIVVTGHLGAFDFIGQYIISDRFRPLALTAPTVGNSLFTGVTYFRSSRGARLAVAGPNSLRKVIAELRRGGMVVMVADRDFGDSGYITDFFGTPTRLPAGPVKLARQFDCPIIPVFTYRRSIKVRERQFYFRIGQPIWVPKTASREQDVRDGMRTIVEMLESYIRRAPEQWVMFKSVWKPVAEQYPITVAQRKASVSLDGGVPRTSSITGAVSSASSVDEPLDPTVH